MFSSKNYSDSYYYIFFNVVSCLTVTILTVFGVSQALGKTSFQQDLQNANADTITVTGTVTSQEDEKPLPGVSVLIKGTKEGTTTDEKGRYTIEVPANKSTLSFSFLGYKTQEVAIDGKKTINVRLKREVEEMEDVVVVGYGTQRKQDLTGSISSVTANEIQDQNITSADQALQGRVAGVHVTKNSGAPGGGSTVRIRGTNSIRAGNNPLYVIDGMPIGGGSSPSQNPLSLINPQDIVSIEVLKDASATAIYGARGANGVVLITTKQGGGNTQVSFEAKYGINQVRKKLDLLNRQEFMSLANEASTNSGGNLVFTQPASEYANTDWQEEVFRRAPRQDYQLSVSGGNKGTRYAISANFLNEKGILIVSDYKRGSFRINFDKQVSNNFSIGNNLVVSQAYYNLIETGGRGLSGIANGALQIPSVVPVKDQNGNYVYQTAEVPVQRDNPVASATEKTNNSDRFKGVGNVYATYMITKGLEARVSIGGNLSYDKNDFYAPENTLQGRQTGGYGSVSTSKSFRWVNENTISYENEFLGLHKLDLLGGFTLERATSENLRGASAGFVTDAFEYHNLNAGEVPSNPATDASESSLVSYIGRVHYGFDERYLVTLTGRIDGSSRFGEGNKYGFFPSGALAWRVTNEPFMEDQNVFSNIKLRLSYGVTGNQAIGNYAALTQLGNSQVTFGDRVAVGINPASLGNEDLPWEKTTQYNSGLDLGLFNNRISLTTDIYYKKTTDLLLIRRVPRYTGYSQYLDNIGSTENRGVELTLDTQNITNSNFSWTSSVNFAMNRNEVLKLSDGEPLLVGTPISYASGQSFRIIQEGKSLGAFYGYKYGGVYSDQQEINNNPAASSSAQPGDPYLLDISGPEGQPDGTIDGNDRTIVGNGFPDFTFGFTNNFVYRGFDLSFFIQGLYGNEILNMNTLRLETGRGYLNQTSDLLNRWTPENRNTDIPRAARSRSSASQTAMRAISSRLIEDGSYVRLKNITLGYSFPVDWINRFGARSVRLYVSAQNLYTLTNYSGYDPEVSTYNNLGNLGADYGTYPKAKTYLMGIELGF